MRSSQRRAVEKYRARLGARGMARFEVLAREEDRDLIRSLARRLSEETVEAARLRAAVGEALGGTPPARGGVLAALRRSPLVGSDLHIEREKGEGRGVDL